MGYSIGGSGLRQSTSYAYPGQNTYQVAQITAGPGSIGRPLEIINVGYTGHEPASTRHNAPGGLVKTNWSVSLAHNWTWDSANNRATTSNGLFATCAIEAGGEGASMHAAPVGVAWYSSPTMGWLVTGQGPRGTEGSGLTYCNHSMNPLFIHYDSVNSGLRSWNPSTSADPLLYLHTNEAKGTLNELMKLEGNGSWTAINFYRSSGTLNSKTAVGQNVQVGSISSLAYDGTNYQKTAEITFITRGTIGSGNAGQSIAFRTGASNTASLATRMEVMDDGTIQMPGLPTASAGLAANTLWSDSGTLKVA